MNLNRAMLVALVVAALSTYQAWAVDVPGAAGTVPQGVQNATAPIQNPPLPAAAADAAGAVQGAAGAVQRGAQNSALPNQIPPPSTGVNVTVPGAAQVTVGQPTVAGNQITDNRPDRWRYRFENNRWWYFTPESRWMIYGDQYGWTYPESAGGYTTAYAAPAAPAAVEYAAPAATYYTYPGYRYYNGYPGRYYYGRPALYVARPWLWGYRRW
jgi:hypothetical protein